MVSVKIDGSGLAFMSQSVNFLFKNSHQSKIFRSSLIPQISQEWCQKMIKSWFPLLFFLHSVQLFYHCLSYSEKQQSSFRLLFPSSAPANPGMQKLLRLLIFIKVVLPLTLQPLCFIKYSSDTILKHPLRLKLLVLQRF